jgi:hypothetical protein
MIHAISVLGAAGDVTITWDDADPADRARARADVARLKAAGFSFFLAEDAPADEVAAGKGTLLARRLEAAEVVPEPEPGPGPAAGPEPEPRPVPRRRGRPPKAGRNVVAVRPLAGG